MNIEDRLVSQLKPNPTNARTHPPEQIDMLVCSIRDFGFNNPVLIHGDTIIAGHGRVEAAIMMNRKMVPCIQLSHLSEEEMRAYCVADNRIAEKSEWDYDTLQKELDALQSYNFSLESLGFTEDEVKNLGQDQFLPDEQSSEDDIPPDEGGDESDDTRKSIIIKAPHDEVARARAAIADAIDGLYGVEMLGGR